MDVFKQCLGKEGAKKDNIRHEKSLSRIILVHHGMPKSPWLAFILPKGSHENMIKSLIQVVPGQQKENDQGIPFTSNALQRVVPHTDPELWNFCHSYKAQNTSISKRYDVNARCEYHERVGGHSVENYMTFKDKVRSLINSDPTKFRELVNGHQKH